MCIVLNAGSKRKANAADFKNFKVILEETISELKKMSVPENKGEFWEAFEEIVFETMKNKLKDKKTINSSLEKWEVFYIKRSHRFPDITYENSENVLSGFGVEVKTISSAAKKWTTKGGSILETTRVKDIDAIYVLCAKKKNPIEIKCKRFEDCIVDVSVTHSPRYVLDMEADDDQNYFVRLGTTYEDVRKDPVKSFREILKNNPKKSKKNKIRWYDLDNEIDYSEVEKKEQQIALDFDMLNFVFWGELRTKKDKERKRNLIAQMFVGFPEVFRGKYDNACKWLIISEKVICKNMRDRFSSGGRGTINGIQVPKIYKNLSDYQEDIIQVFRNEKINLPFENLQNYFNDWRDYVEKAIVDADNKDYCLNSQQFDVVNDIIKNIERGVKKV